MTNIFRHDVALFACDMMTEHARAIEKFPSNDLGMIALMEEVGELAKAMLDEDSERVRKEAIQVAVMAMRACLEGDGSVVEFRASKGLDHPAASA